MPRVCTSQAMRPRKRPLQVDGKALPIPKKSTHGKKTIAGVVYSCLRSQSSFVQGRPPASRAWRKRSLVSTSAVHAILPVRPVATKLVLHYNQTRQARSPSACQPNSPPRCLPHIPNYGASRPRWRSQKLQARTSHLQCIPWRAVWEGFGRMCRLWQWRRLLRVLKARKQDP